VVNSLFLHTKYSAVPEVVVMCQNAREKYVTSPHPASLLLDIYEQEKSKESLKKAIEVRMISES
jgi:hypothetical protein